MGTIQLIVLVMFPVDRSKLLQREYSTLSRDLETLGGNLSWLPLLLFPASFRSVALPIGATKNRKTEKQVTLRVELQLGARHGLSCNVHVMI